LLSDPPSLINEDLKSIEGQIFIQDQLSPQVKKNSHNPSNIMEEDICTTSQHVLATNSPSLSDYLQDSPRPLISRVRVQDAQVEVPLMPAAVAKKTVTFDCNVEEMLLDEWRE